ncbi:MFS transporter [Candidatus Saccharibacteria bacterium]|nr:MFS transporter [Candidatus Saccharibacteria bacterium]
MKKRFLSLFIFIASVFAGGFLLSATANAVPTLPVPNDPTPPIETPVEPTPDPTPNPNPDPTPTPDPSDPDYDGETEENEDAPPVNHCVDQMGAMAWIVCGAINIIATGTDAAMSILSSLLTISMGPEVFDSPLFYIWQFVRNISNILFVIMFLIMIFSHFTQWNIANYALRRALPRLAVVAILVNLSFYISVAAVNLSDIVGVSLVGLFDSIIENAAASGTMTFADIPTWQGITSLAIGGVAAGAGFLALLYFGPTLIFILLPVLLSAVVAILAALFTMAARQALIFLLVMLSPLAFVSLLLSSTEHLFSMWKKFFLQMLIIFPMFAFLFGASRLAGWAIISTATGALQVVLGMAVMAVPLAMTPALLRMSGTVLNKVNDLARRPFAPAQSSLAGYAKEKEMINRARRINQGMGKTYNPSAKLAAFMEKQRALRGEDFNQQSGMLKNRIGAYVDDYVQEHELVKGNRQFKHRLGENAKQAGVDETLASVAKYRRANVLSEASGWTNDTDHIAATARQRRLGKISSAGTDAWMQQWTEEQRNSENNFNDEIYRTGRLGDAYHASERYEALKATNGYAPTEEEQKKIDDYNRFVRPIEGTAYRTDDAKAIAEGKIMRDRSVSRAMETRNMLSRRTYKAYHTLFSDTKLTDDIRRSLVDSFQEHDWDKMEAAIDVMAVRGDYNLIMDEIRNATSAGHLFDSTIQADIASEGNKRLMDTLVKFKSEAAPLAMYCKSMNIRRGKWGNFEGEIRDIMENNLNLNRDQAIDFYFEGKATKNFDAYSVKMAEEQNVSPDAITLKQVSDRIRSEKEADFKAVNIIEWVADKGDLGMAKLLGNISSPGTWKTQDRTVWEFLPDLVKRAADAGNDVDHLTNGANIAGVPIKYLRSAATSGEIDGEVLANLNKMIVGRETEEGYKVNVESLASYFGDMSAKQFAGLKAGQAEAVNDALMGKGAYKAGNISPALLKLLNNAIYDVANGNSTLRQEMNTDIRAKFHVDKQADRKDKREGSDEYLFEGDASRPNISRISDLEPTQLEMFVAMQRNSTELVKNFFNRSELVEKLNDYYLAENGNVTGSWNTDNVADEIQSIVDRLSDSDKLSLDADMKWKLGIGHSPRP